MFRRTLSDALIQSAQLGRHSKVRLLLEHGADVNAADEYGADYVD